MKRIDSQRERRTEDSTKNWLESYRARPAHYVEVGPESLKLVILAPQITGKARLVYAAMSDHNAKDYDRVKATIFCCYDINEETYRWQFREVSSKEKETPVICIWDLAEKWLKGCVDCWRVVDE